MTDSQPELADRALLEAFEDCSHPHLTHHEHVRLGYLYLRESGLTEVLVEFPKKLRAYAGSKGAHDLYHETITWAWMILINERIHAGPSDSWRSFAAANLDLLGSRVLERYYSAQLLDSELARRVFVLPGEVLR